MQFGRCGHDEFPIIRLDVSERYHKLGRFQKSSTLFLQLKENPTSRDGHAVFPSHAHRRQQMRFHIHDWHITPAPNNITITTKAMPLLLLSST